MTIIAWDGKSLAADKRATCNGSLFTTTKIRRIKRPGRIAEVLAWTGEQDAGEMLAQWYEEGASPTEFPACQKTEAWARLIVADQYGAKFFERLPVAVDVEDAFAAWGSGCDLARAALFLGKSAKEAVEVASLFDIGCGNGVDVFDLCPPE